MSFNFDIGEQTVWDPALAIGKTFAFATKPGVAARLEELGRHMCV